MILAAAAVDAVRTAKTLNGIVPPGCKNQVATAVTNNVFRLFCILAFKLGVSSLPRRCKKLIPFEFVRLSKTNICTIQNDGIITGT